MRKGKIEAYFVDYNGKIMGIYRTLNGALRMIRNKDFKDDTDNTLRLVDNNGDMYNPYNGLRM